MRDFKLHHAQNQSLTCFSAFADGRKALPNFKQIIVTRNVGVLIYIMRSRIGALFKRNLVTWLSAWLETFGTTFRTTLSATSALSANLFNRRGRVHRMLGELA